VSIERREALDGAVLYFDHAAASPIRPEVAEVMERALRIRGNPSSPHRAGRQARQELEEARETIAGRLGVLPEEIVFTSGGTEANALAVAGTARARRPGGTRRHIVTSRAEHPSVLETCRALEREGFEVTRVGVDRFGQVDPDEVAQALRKDTILVSIQQGNHEVGTLQPIESIGRIVRSHGIPFHTDAVQSFGYLLPRPAELGVDLLSAASHKLGGPAGVGLLYARKGVSLMPLQSGGAHEFSRRAGTENLSGILGMAEAIELACLGGPADRARIESLRNRLEAGLRDRIEDVVLNGHPRERLPHICHACFPGIEGEGVVLGLDLEGIAVAPGSACTTDEPGPSHILTAMGIDPALARSATRFSLGWTNDPGQVDRVIDRTTSLVSRIRMEYTCLDHRMLN
jgi:cysteine desulfurase